jgi:hypothetical protein
MSVGIDKQGIESFHRAGCATSESAGFRALPILFNGH